MEFVFSGELPEKEVIREMKTVCQWVLKEEGVSSSRLEISISFVDQGEIQQINRDYRSKDCVTDVLSFPQYSAPEEIPQDQPALLGDVVLCLDKIKSQAREYGHSEKREVFYLLIHSLLHLLGYDHKGQEDKEKMRGREKAIIKELRIFS